MPFDTGLPLTTEVRDDLFDLTIRGQRSATYTFTLVEVITGMVVGTLTPLADSAPTLSHDTTRSVKRTVTLSVRVGHCRSLVNPIRPARGHKYACHPRPSAAMRREGKGT